MKILLRLWAARHLHQRHTKLISGHALGPLKINIALKEEGLDAVAWRPLTLFL